MTQHATSSDAALVRAVRAGDDRAFEEVVARYRPALVRHARRVLSSDAAAEDAVQESLWRAHRALRRSGADGVLLRPWLHRIVRNACLDELRRTVAVAELPLVEPEAVGQDPLCHAIRAEALRELVADVDTLPARQRFALVQHAVDGAAHADLAVRLGVTEGATKNLVNRARVALAAARDAREAAVAA